MADSRARLSQISIRVRYGKRPVQHVHGTPSPQDPRSYKAWRVTSPCQAVIIGSHTRCTHLLHKLPIKGFQLSTPSMNMSLISHYWLQLLRAVFIFFFFYVFLLFFFGSYSQITSLFHFHLPIHDQLDHSLWDSVIRIDRFCVLVGYPD